jgi:ABC-type Fe3+-hydroxamate transport system substrate-binding protein
VQVASAPEPAALAIGTLSTGGDASPQSQQQAQDLIASILKRIAALPAKTADAQKKQIRQIKTFILQAQKALNSGDAEGAKNLATKAKLLMDDLEKK